MEMSCGGCGHDQFKVYTEDPSKGIMVECQKCKSVSVIVPKVELQIKFGENSEGRLCIM